MVVIAVVMAVIRAGTLSGSITWNTVCQVFAPEDWAISMMFGFSSRRAPSTSRATKGNAAITSGTITPASPTADPSSIRVKGISSTIRMMKGADRSRLMIQFSTVISHLGSGRIPLASPVTRITPRGSPIRMASRVETRVIYSVENVADRKSSWMITQASAIFFSLKYLARYSAITPPPPP